jgi:Tfp pilus assembly pilus retraction ATPase PilT
MSVLASLIAALERANGDRLVLCSGETPHVIAGGTRHDLGTTKASVKALEALTHQILSPEARREFAATNAALEPLSEAISPIPLVVGTHRSGDTIRIELRRLRAPTAEPSPLPAPVPVAADDRPVAPPPATVGQPEQPGDDAEWQPVDVQAAEHAGLETRIAELVRAVDEHATERDRLQTRITELEAAATSQASERERVEARVAELEAAASAQAIERERLEQHIAALERMAHDRAAEQTPLQTQIAEMARAAADHASERAQLEMRIAELQAAASTQAAERERVEARVADLEAGASASAIERERLEQHVADLERAGNDHAAEQTQLKTRIAELTRAANDHAAERTQLETHVAELARAGNDHATERTRLETRVAELTRAANDHAAERTRLETRVAELTRAADDLASERTRLEMRIAELQAEASTQTGERERAEARVAELEAVGSAYPIERGRLEQRIAEPEALTSDATRVASDSLGADPVVSESVEANPATSELLEGDWLQPASGLGEGGFDEDAFGQSTVLAPDAEQDSDEASFGMHQMKVVPIAAAIRTGAPTGATDSRGRSDAEALEYWIRQAALRDATTLYLRAGHAPLLRVRQKLQSLDDQPLDRSMIDTLTAALAASENDWAPVSDTAWTRELDGIGRVTCQTFLDECGAGLVAHLSPRGAASALCKDIPRHVRRVCEEDNGLVIVSAPVLPDVMQMVAALGEWTAQRRAGYLVSIEPPNGLGHDISGILVSARRIAGTERDVADAIRRAMHEGPDILVIALASGLIAEEAIRAAQSGCLVIVGVIAPTAPRAIEALLSNVDPAHAQPLRQSVAASYRCGFSYRALPGRDGTRTVVQDLLTGTSDVRARLERRDLGGLESVQRSGIGGMRSLDAALAAAVHRRETTLRRAAGMACDRRELVRLVRRAAQQRNRAARGESIAPSFDPAPVIAGVRA